MILFQMCRSAYKSSLTMFLTQKLPFNFISNMIKNKPAVYNKLTNTSIFLEHSKLLSANLVSTAYSMLIMLER